MLEAVKKEISKQEVLEFLKKKELAVVSTVSPDCKPESATVIYFVDNGFNFYFVTRRNTRKSDNLESNRNVAIVVGTELAPMTVQMEGVAELVNGSDFFTAELAKHPTVQNLYFGPFLAMPGMNFATYKVKINWLRWLTVNQETGEESYLQVI